MHDNDAAPAVARPTRHSPRCTSKAPKTNPRCSRPLTTTTDQDDNDQGYPNAHADWSLTFHRRNDIDVLTAVRNHAGASRTGSSGVCVLVCNGLDIDLTLPRSKTPIPLPPTTQRPRNYIARVDESSKKAFRPVPPACPGSAPLDRHGWILPRLTEARIPPRGKPTKYDGMTKPRPSPRRVSFAGNPGGPGLPPAQVSAWSGSTRQPKRSPPRFRNGNVHRPPPGEAERHQDERKKGTSTTTRGARSAHECQMPAPPTPSCGDGNSGPFHFKWAAAAPCILGRVARRWCAADGERMMKRCQTIAPGSAEPPPTERRTT